MVAILYLLSSNGNIKNKKLVGKPGLWLKTVIRRGVNGGKVIEETFAGKFKRWLHSKRMNGFIIYTEKITIFTI